ncbi:hypothetical protein F4813DRAFT_362203 [Daldinia decipiens]|uniref:uncharacterized protein n=1 Tax=Daldinia decipiens TaxID=326647 RepID=UPI0020C40E70|nr:uncharacterized protein F4813DRAFT_362203 [Daldinia decipiens]KAI1656896.1 hypothetical protein F4813DRAFT_362203 [Daldinia decipiens]
MELQEIEDRRNAKHFGFKPPPPRRPRRSLPHDPPRTRPSKRSRSSENPCKGTPFEGLECDPDDLFADNYLIKKRSRAKEKPRRILKTEYGTFELFDSGFWVLKGVGPDYKLKLPLAVGLREELEPIMDYEDEDELYPEDADAYQFPDTPEESDSAGSQLGGEREMTERLASMGLMDDHVDPPYASMEVENHESIVDKEEVVVMTDDDLPHASPDVEDHETRVEKGKGKEKERVVIVIDDDNSDEDYVSRQNVLRNFGASSSSADPFNVVPEGAVARRSQRPGPMNLPRRNSSQRAGQAANLDDLYQSLSPQNPTEADYDKYQKMARLYPHLFCDDRTKLLPNGYIPSSRIIRFDGQQIGVVHFFPDLLPVIPGYDMATTITYVLSGAHDRTGLEPWPFLWRIQIKFDSKVIGTVEFRQMPVPLPPPANLDESSTDLLKIHSPLRRPNAPPVDIPNAPPVDEQVSWGPSSNVSVANEPAASSNSGPSRSIAPMTALPGHLFQPDGLTKIEYCKTVRAIVYGTVKYNDQVVGDLEACPVMSMLLKRVRISERFNKLFKNDGLTKVDYNPATRKLDVLYNNALFGHIKINHPTGGLPQGPPPPSPAAPAV